MVMYPAQDDINALVSDVMTASPADISISNDGAFHDMWIISDLAVRRLVVIDVIVL